MDIEVADMSHTDVLPRSVVITGASTGIGEACALELDRRGFRVFAGVRTDDAAAKLRAKASGRLTPVPIDVTDAGSIGAAARLVGQAVGEAGLAGLVNNAGIAVPGPLEALPIDALRRQFEVNVIGQVAVTQAFLPLLRKARGRVVNMSSLNGALSPPYLGAYSASKFALEAVSDALRGELRQWGIGVSVVEPGQIDTPIWVKSTAFADQLAKDVAPDVLALYEAEMAAMRQTGARLARTAEPVDRVVRAVLHALLAKRPKTRYFLGWPVRLSFKGMRMLPDWLRDWIVRKQLGLR
jgi:NAD(P)-dependent dehydrogenase (short-subunit alcohol dehydrogenase family)